MHKISTQVIYVNGTHPSCWPSGGQWAFFLSWSDIYLQPQFQCQTFERTHNCLITAGLSSSITNDELTDQHFEQKL